MRYINRDHLRFPNGWSQKAQEMHDSIECLTPEDRRRVLESRRAQQIWKELKDALAELSKEKCWYCEENTSLGDVDHFHPKGKVTDCDDHPGYWWLAFDWKNYRFACPSCNRLNKDNQTGNVGGKGCSFPLCDSHKRAYNEADMVYEEPILLDPVVGTDPRLLTFDEDGTARPARNEETSPSAYQRAQESINIYHLNRSKLKNRRQFNVCNKIKQLIAEGDNFFLLMTMENDIAAREGYRRVVETLLKMVDEYAEYSAAAKSVLRQYRDHEWVEELLSA